MNRKEEVLFSTIERSKHQGKQKMNFESSSPLVQTLDALAPPLERKSRNCELMCLFYASNNLTVIATSNMSEYSAIFASQKATHFKLDSKSTKEVHDIPEWCFVDRY